MIKQYSSIFRRGMILVDALLITAVFIISYWFRAQNSSGLPVLDSCIWLSPVVVLSWVGALYSLGMYKSFRLKSMLDILRIIINAGLIAFVCFGAVMYLYKVVNLSRIFILMVFGLTAITLSVEKLILFYSFKEVRRRGFNFRNVLIVGTNKRAHRFIRMIDTHRDLGLKVVGILDEDPLMVGQTIGGHEVMGTFKDLPGILIEQAIDQVVIIASRSNLHKIEPLVLHCETIGTTVSVSMDIFNSQFTVGLGENVLGLPLITFQTVSNKTGQLVLKRIMDILVSGALIIITAPLNTIIAILVKVTSKGPVFFIQERCGLQGRKFNLYKFRTMCVDAEARLEALKHKNEMEGPAFKIANDPRVTPLGKFLRKWSLDELPQLWNIFHGHMSLVGPRPPMPREVAQYDYWQRRRLSIRPGLTGLWQVSGRNNISKFDDLVKLDLQYMDHWSLMEDFKILARTIPAVLKGTGAR